jgi:hypothetical protein
VSQSPQVVERWTSGKSLSPGFPALLVHSKFGGLRAVSNLGNAEGFGMVFCIPQRGRATNADSVLRHVSENDGDLSHVLLDTGSYSGRSRKLAVAGIDPSWVKFQLARGVRWALTDSGYVGQGDLSGLRRLLTGAAGMGGNVICLLPLHHSWLKARRAELAEEINSAGVPVALILEHSGDPLNSREAVRGLIEVLRWSQPPVLLLRCDLSAIGAVAWGAATAAIGTTTGMRHLYPVKHGGGGRAPSIAALVPRAFSYVALEKLNDAIVAAPAEPYWYCDCRRCFGRRMDWIVTEDEAFEHTLSAVGAVAEHVLDTSLTMQQRQDAWAAICHSAQFDCMDIEGITGGGWTPAPFLGSWLAASAISL